MAGTLAGVQSVPATLYNLEPWLAKSGYLEKAWRMLEISGDVPRCAVWL